MGFSLISAAEILYHCFVSLCSDHEAAEDAEDAMQKSRSGKKDFVRGKFAPKFKNAKCSTRALNVLTIDSRRSIDPIKLSMVVKLFINCSFPASFSPIFGV